MIRTFDMMTWLQKQGVSFPNVAAVPLAMLDMPGSVASVERGYCIVHHISADGRRNLDDEVVAFEMCLRYMRSLVARHIDTVGASTMLRPSVFAPRPG